jgi:4-hydroxybenzoate polyprenyltransferase
VVTGLFLMPASLSVSVVLAVQVGWGFCAALAGYFVLTCAYSFRLKELVLVDCMTLTALYTARLVSGAIAVSVPLSFWLLAFSIFIFLSLAFVKRYAELHVQTAAGKTDIAGRGYVGSDASVIQMLGTASGYSAVMVLALYINSSAVVRLYSLPQALWFCIPLVIYWISRMWVKTHRGEMLDDPVLFAIRDRTSLLVLALLALSFLCAAAGRPVLEPWLELLGLQRQ